jgi:hypothetical protein
MCFYMKIINKYSLENKKTATNCSGLIFFVNLIFSENLDLTDENNTNYVYLYEVDFILKVFNKSILKYLHVVLYDKFNRLAITY